MAYARVTVPMGRRKQPAALFILIGMAAVVPGLVTRAGATAMGSHQRQLRGSSEEFLAPWQPGVDQPPWGPLSPAPYPQGAGNDNDNGHNMPPPPPPSLPPSSQPPPVYGDQRPPSQLHPVYGDQLPSSPSSPLAPRPPRPGSTPDQYQVRLVGGSAPNEGRVEIFYGGEWGTVCDDGFSDREAAVVCRQLGYETGTAVMQWAVPLPVWAGGGSGPIHMDDVRCYEFQAPKRIDNCQFQGWGVHNCAHYEDVGVRCQVPSSPSPPPQPPSTPSTPFPPTPPRPPRPPRPGSTPDEYQVRLVGGSAPNEGRVEIFYGGEWGTVCDDGFTDREATVVCRELGYAWGVAMMQWYTPPPQWGPGSGPIYMDDVACYNAPVSPARLHQCVYRQWGTHNCAHSEDVGVQCHGVREPLAPPAPPSRPPLPPSPSLPPAGPLPDQYQVRLVGGSAPNEGRVEIFYGSEWGTVCDDFFTDREAHVVCRELGYARGTVATLWRAPAPSWGPGSGPIHMDNVACTNTPEPTRLSQCSFNGWGLNDCVHGEDVGVRCSGTRQPTSPPLPPTPPASPFIPSSVIAANGGYHTCSISVRGSLKCWGANYNGQLGLGDTNNRGDQPGEMGASLPTVDLGPGLYATAVAAGGMHTCALLQPGGIVKCWGNNDFGQLGQGDFWSRGSQPGEMGAALPAVDLGQGLVAVALAAGNVHTCVILQPGGIVKCWGLNANGQLGLGDRQNRGHAPSQMGSNLPAVQLGTGLVATALAAGWDFTCALLQPGPVVKCWGGNDQGQLGLGDIAPRGVQPGQMGDLLPAVDLGPGYNATALTASGAHVCALLQPVGVVKCWGSNLYGVLGLGDGNTRGDGPNEMGVALRRVDFGRRVAATAVAAGQFHNCALLQPGGVVKCWGDNNFRQLGPGLASMVDFNSSALGDQAGELGTALRALDFGPGLIAVALTAGAYHNCALLQPGNQIKCWGSNSQGALGLGRSEQPSIQLPLGASLPAVVL